MDLDDNLPVNIDEWDMQSLVLYLQAGKDKTSKKGRAASVTLGMCRIQACMTSAHFYLMNVFDGGTGIDQLALLVSIFYLYYLCDYHHMTSCDVIASVA